MVSRDTHSLAFKAVSAMFNNKRVDLFKDPKTDTEFKKSAKGLLRVEKENGTYVLYDQQTEEQENSGCLQRVFFNGRLTVNHTLKEIRSRAYAGL